MRLVEVCAAGDRRGWVKGTMPRNPKERWES